jgi:two-component system, OmpR family, sensor kinase
MRHLPIRVRVAAAFAAAMALVLAATGVFLYSRLGADLARALDQDLRLRAQDLSALVSDPRNSLRVESRSHLIEPGESFAQLLDRSGRVLDETRLLGSRPLLRPNEIAAVLRQDRVFDRSSVPGLDEPARLLAVPVERGGRQIVLVVGATRENRAEALRSLRTELLIAGPVALVLATLLGYLLAGAGLRAVDAMRRHAAEISAERAHERLPVARTGDELQQLGDTLNAMLDRLEQALDRERGFVAEAGHELRTPLALLRAELDYALHYAETEAELRIAVREASQETDRLVQLAGDLLLLASSDQGRLPLRPERFAVSAAMESVRQRFAWRAEAEGRVLVLDADDDPIIEADRVRLEQALGNLLENALRHGDGAVTLSAVIADGAVELHVRDQGSGFPSEFLSRAFERFTRAEESRSGHGAGLGLAIVQTIAQVHRGQATAANHPEGGADVAIRLAATTEGLAEAASADPQRQRHRHAARDPGAKPVPTRTST